MRRGGLRRQPLKFVLETAVLETAVRLTLRTSVLEERGLEDPVMLTLRTSDIY